MQIRTFFIINVDIFIKNVYYNYKETITMNNLINFKLNNWWNVWEENHPYKFVVL